MHYLNAKKTLLFGLEAEKQGNLKNIKMKVRRFSQTQGLFIFPNFDNNYDELFEAFQRTRLGSIYNAIPWDEMAKEFHLKEYSKGPQCIFSPRGKIALMILKHYAGCSDSKLIEQLNGNIHYQIFCDIIIPPSAPITNYKIVSEIRCELAAKLDIERLQKVLAKHWKPYMTNLDSMVCDATCYESDIRYPTDIKLLWEAVEWNYSMLVLCSQKLRIQRPRTKYSKWVRRYTNYSKSKRPSRKEKRALRRALFKLLNKINLCLIPLENQLTSSFDNRYWQRRDASQIVLEQQWGYFFDQEKPTNRIVSLDKPYIRPIVRGKEVKKVEFGAKVNKIQVDGISFIEHLSFDAFNEGIRLKKSIWMTQKLFGKKLKVVGADRIYANNKNRTYVTKLGIKTDFKRKGRPSKHKNQFDQLAVMITKERATRLEGSFGTDKEHFLLKRIKARTKQTEILWMFFGIHTSNAIRIGQRMAKSKLKAA